MRLIIKSFYIFSLLLLVACQQQNELFNEIATKIEVQKWNSQEQILIIDDENLIEDLVSKLESADSVSTADIDIPNPDYRLIFLNQNEVINEIGYYQEVKSYKGITGRYIHFSEGIHFKVEHDLLIENNE